MIAPAPRKPTPVTICAAMRVGSKTIPSLLEKCQSVQPYADTSVNSAEPSETSRWVRNPASRSRSSRSTPINPPSSAASASRRSDSSQLRVGSWLDASCSNSFLLDHSQLFDPGGRKFKQVVEASSAERRLLRGGLYLDERTVAGHDHVHVD